MIFAAQLLPNKLNAWKITAISLALASIGLVKVRFDVGSAMFQLIGLIALLIFLVIPVLFYSGKMWKQYAVYIFFLILMVLSDSICGVFITMIYDSIDIVFAEMTPMLIYNGFCTTIYILFGSIAVFAWRMIAARRFHPFFLLFFILPIGQFITVFSFTWSTWTVFWMLGVLISMVASLILLVYTISQEKKTELEEELRETRHAMELE